MNPVAGATGMNGPAMGPVACALMTTCPELADAPAPVTNNDGLACATEIVSRNAENTPASKTPNLFPMIVPFSAGAQDRASQLCRGDRSLYYPGASSPLAHRS